MGVIAVPRASVNEWVLPAPRVTVGEAVVALEGDRAASVAGVASAPVAATSPCFVTVTVLGVAGVEGEGDTFVFPAPVGDAALSVDGVSETALPHVTTGVAYAETLGVSDVVVVGECVAGVVVVPTASLAVPQLGSAEVEIEYYGDGDVPIFPFNLPFLFMEIDFSNIDAAAIAEVVSSADVDVDVTGEAALQFTGSVSPSGGAPAEALETVGEAAVDIIGASVVETLVDAAAVVVVDALSPGFYSSVLPTRLPFIFIE